MSNNTDQSALRIVVDDLSGPAIAALLAQHLDDMYATSPAESVHALDLDALRKPEITFWSAWDSGELVGCGALKELDPTHGELKSMRTATAARGRGVASNLLRHLIAQARERGYTRLSLETGTQPYFAPARRLYTRNGFAECPPFADYILDPNSVFMTLAL
ncbi:GNAT family N-acetyltransferase [Nocardia arthritidis]|uniref:GNAT family N-acetyltransferase n=1 Tax=Nocardia arthritidis TaxID=228602 RepID=A0A6G9YKU3_9NOCA|nr:GNAT family N-acetyltransferase [Nocardia arthritidis]QIS13824.1 GNAT family N-acetyltransferase [Nocardia arthritidis]